MKFYHPQVRNIILVAFFFTVFISTAQDSLKRKKGSYLSYGQPNIEDNSMFIEEAFNQETAIIQHISNFIVDGGNLAYSYTQEIPMPNDRNQFSFTFLYNVLNSKPLKEAPSNHGFGDLLLNFRPMLMDKND